MQETFVYDLSPSVLWVYLKKLSKAILPLMHTSISTQQRIFTVRQRYHFSQLYRELGKRKNFQARLEKSRPLSAVHIIHCAFTG